MPLFKDGPLKNWPPVRLTQFVPSRVVGDLHEVELQARVALPDAVDAGDVGTRLVHRPHQLANNNNVA